jgi:hypothetical protein
MPVGAIFVSYAAFPGRLPLPLHRRMGMSSALAGGIDISASHGADDFGPKRLDIDPPPIEAGP